MLEQGKSRTFMPGQSMNDSGPGINISINSAAPAGTIQSLNSGGGGVMNVVPVPPHEDAFKDKILQYIQGPDIGLCDIVERTVLVNGKPSLIFKSGFQTSIEDVNRNMIPTDIPGTFVAALQGMMDSQAINQPVADINESNFMNHSVMGGGNRFNAQPLSPIAQILQKRKSSLIELSLSVKLDLPSANLFNMLLEDFEATPEEIFKECLNEKNMELLTEQLSVALLKKYCPDYKKPKEEAV
jgi:hypothetical protein